MTGEQSARWASPFLSDVLWLLTMGSETRATAPHRVQLGVAAAAVSDLETIGEVTWSGLDATSTLSVRSRCRCEDGTLRRWHRGLAEAAGGEPLPARFTLSSLARTAWRDTAQRLVAEQLVLEVPAHMGHGRGSAFAVRDPQSVEVVRRDLREALTRGRADERQHDLVIVAWATSCFDDLFHAHGWEASQALMDAARDEALEDATYSRITAASGFREGIFLR